MISRVADNCFWFGRYLERAESTARLLQVTSALALDGDLTPLQSWQPVVIIAGERERFVAAKGEEALGDGEVVQEYLSFGRVGVCIERSIAAARENARSVREVVSLEAWESINELHLWMQSTAARCSTAPLCSTSSATWLRRDQAAPALARRGALRRRCLVERGPRALARVARARRRSRARSGCVREFGSDRRARAGARARGLVVGERASRFARSQPVEVTDRHCWPSARDDHGSGAARNV